VRTGPSVTTRYRERLGAAPWMWALAALLVLSFGLVFLVVAGPAGSVMIMLLLALLSVWGLHSYGATVVVGDGVLHAGRAHIGVEHLGAVTVLDADAAREVRGAKADARAYLVLRASVPTAVVVDVVDPRDPTPYWYISTRRPRALAAAIKAEQAAEQALGGRETV
jgi:DUF3093 family protein